jgi:hypothetical protein
MGSRAASVAVQFFACAGRNHQTSTSRAHHQEHQHRHKDHQRSHQKHPPVISSFNAVINTIKTAKTISETKVGSPSVRGVLDGENGL